MGERITTERVRELLALARKHGRTLTNGGEESPKWEETAEGYDGDDAEPTGWDIYVADGQYTAHVPYMTDCDAPPLEDWRDAICESGQVLLGLAAYAEQQAADLIAARERIAALEAERDARVTVGAAAADGDTTP